jgi:hypothetical protein
MAAGNDFGRFSQELSSHYLSGVASQGVLHKQKDKTYVNWTGLQCVALYTTIRKKCNELQSEISREYT